VKQTVGGDLKRSDSRLKQFVYSGSVFRIKGAEGRERTYVLLSKVRVVNDLSRNIECLDLMKMRQRE
jgi:hypothetical protein